MIEVEVLIKNFRDKENKQLGLLQSGYKYSISKERAKELANKGIVKIVEMKKSKESKEE